MGRPRKIVNETSGQEFITSTVSIGSENLPTDPIQAVKAEIKQEREASKYPTKHKMFDVQIADNDDHFDWITQMFCQHFKLGPVGFKSNVTQWNFPKAIGETKKTHRVKRQFVTRGIMVDVFNGGTKKDEINRIKAHLEALGFTYTYIIGGEVPDPKVVFENRLAKLDKSSANYPKLSIPKDLAEAGYAGFNSSVV